jgi:predicted ATPase
VEHPYAVRPLSFPASPVGNPMQIEDQGVSSPSPAADQSVELFLAHALLVDHRFVLTSENMKHLTSICHQLAGNPLTIELVASLKGEMTLEEIGDGLRKRFAHLPENSRSFDLDTPALDTVLDWVYGHLAPDEQTLLNRLSVFAGGWTPEAATHVCREEDAPAPELSQRLTALANRSLISYEEIDGAARYTMRFTIREYAQQKLELQPDAQTYYQAHQKFFLALAEQGERAMDDQDQAKWLSVLKREHANLCAALDSCERTPSSEETRIRLVGALCRFWLKTANYAEGLEWCRLVEQDAETFQRSEGKAKVLNGAKQLASHSAD